MKRLVLIPLFLLSLVLFSCQEDLDKDPSEKDPMPLSEELIKGHWQNTFITSEYYNSAGKKIYEFGYDPNRYLNFDGDSCAVTNYTEGWPYKVPYTVTKQEGEDFLKIADGTFVKGEYKVASINKSSMVLQISLNNDPNGYYYQNPDNHQVSGYAPIKITTYRFAKK